AARDLERAAAACLELGHPNIASILQTFEFEGHRAVVFEGVHGMSLAQVVERLDERGEQLSDGAVLEIALGMCRGLAAAHNARGERGELSPLVHSALGPHQIFISFDGEVKVLGLGLGPVFSKRPNLADLPPAAIAHVAPEVKAGAAVTATANTFSAASIMWFALSRQAPPESGSRPPLAEVRPDLDPDLARAVGRALEPDPARR